MALTVLADLKIRLGQALISYLPLCVDVSLPLRQRLDALQKEFNLYGEPPSKQLDHTTMNVNALQFEASVMDGPVINTRAGLYVYLNSMVRYVGTSYQLDTDGTSSLDVRWLMTLC